MKSFVSSGVICVMVFLLVHTLAAQGLATPPSSVSLTLKDLIESDLSIVSGDKLFDHFEYYATGDMPSAEDVNVSAFIDLGGNFGITFQGAFVDSYLSVGGSDALICYQVTAMDPEKFISDAHIYGNPKSIGNALTTITETFLPEISSDDMTIYDIAPYGNTRLVDSVYFDSLYRSLHVQKDILAYAQTAESVASISLISQTFSQVPEPSSVVLLVTGLAMFGLFVRRDRISFRR